MSRRSADAVGRLVFGPLGVVGWFAFDVALGLAVLGLSRPCPPFPFSVFRVLARGVSATTLFNAVCALRPHQR